MNQIFTFTECPIYCRNLLLFINNARLTFSNKLEPKYIVDKAAAEDAVAMDGMTVEIDLDFYPLFQDPIYDAIFNKKAINLNVGGMELTDGFASSFSLQGNHGSLVQGSAKIVFYDFYKNAFNPIQFQRTIYHEVNNKDFQIAHTSLMALSQDLKIEIPMSFSYTYNARFNPIYKVGSEKCQGVRMDRQTIQCSIAGENVDNYVSTFGNEANISFALKDICGNPLRLRRTKFNDEDWLVADTTYSCQGKISSFNTTIAPDEIIKTSVEVIQYL